MSGPKLPASPAHGWRKPDAVEPVGEKEARRRSVFDAVEDILSAIPDGEQVEVRRLLAEVIVRKAMRGNVKMIEAILARSDPVATPSTPGATVNIEFGKLVMGIDAEAMRNGQPPPREVTPEPRESLPPAPAPFEVQKEKQESPCPEVAPE